MPQRTLFHYRLPTIWSPKQIIPISSDLSMYLDSHCTQCSYADVRTTKPSNVLVFSTCFRRAPCSHTVWRSATTPVSRERVPPQHLHHTHRFLNTNSSNRFAMFLLMSFQRVEHCIQAITKKKWNIYIVKQSMSSRTTESSMKTQYHVSNYRFVFSLHTSENKWSL